MKLCCEKTLDMPFLAYYGCSKLLKARAVFYWGTHTRFTVSVGIDLSLTKLRHTRSADCICLDKRARISPSWEIVWIRASYTWQYVKWNIILRFYGISHACANSGAQAIVFFPPPQKKTAWERGSLVPRPSRAPARKRDLSQDFLALLNQHADVFYVIQNDCHVLCTADSNASSYTWQLELELSGVPVQYAVKSLDCFESCVLMGLPVFRTC